MRTIEKLGNLLKQARTLGGSLLMRAGLALIAKDAPAQIEEESEAEHDAPAYPVVKLGSRAQAMRKAAEPTPTTAPEASPWPLPGSAEDRIKRARGW